MAWNTYIAVESDPGRILGVSHNQYDDPPPARPIRVTDDDDLLVLRQGAGDAMWKGGRVMKKPIALFVPDKDTLIADGGDVMVLSLVVESGTIPYPITVRINDGTEDTSIPLAEGETIDLSSERDDPIQISITHSADGLGLVSHATQVVYPEAP